MTHTRFALCFCLIFLSWVTAVGQKNVASSQPRPAPQITGKFLDTDGVRRLTLEYKPDSRAKTFTGNIHSTCMLPGQSRSAAARPLKLSAIPIGTLLTIYYMRHAEKGKPTQTPENVILAVRFDAVPRGLGVPKGVAIPCFTAAGSASATRK